MTLASPSYTLILITIAVMFQALGCQCMASFHATAEDLRLILSLPTLKIDMTIRQPLNFLAGKNHRSNRASGSAYYLPLG